MRVSCRARFAIPALLASLMSSISAVLLNSCSFDTMFPAERYREAVDRASLEELGGNTDGAEKSYLHALRCAESLDKEKTAIVAKKLGWLYLKINKPEAAKAQFTTAQNVYQSLWKEGEGGLRNRMLGTELSDTLHGLANLNRTLGRFGEADALYMRSLQSLDPGLGSHKEQSQIMADYAASLKSQHKDELAQKLLSQSQDLGAVEGTTDSTVQREPFQLVKDGDVESGALNYDKAEELYQAAIDKLGDDPKDRVSQSLLVNAYVGLAQTQDAKKYYGKAKALTSKALAIARKYELTVDLPDVLERLAAVQAHVGDLETAAKTYEEALKVQAIRDQKSDAYFRQSRRMMELLSGVYVKLKRYDDAEAMINRKMAIEIEKYSLKSVKLAVNHVRLAEIADAKGDVEQAVKSYEQAIFIYEHAKKDRIRETIAAYDQYTKFLKKHNQAQKAKRFEERMTELTKEFGD